ncbi:MAG: hypothetical protein ACI9M3_001668 [Bacteroidia bacterium]|jgi:hypothetical protein
MRKILLFTTLAIFIFCTLPSDAQMVTVKEKPSFYLGKRSTLHLVIGIQPTISPMKPEKDVNTDPYKDKILPVFANIKPEITYTFALNNKLSFFAKAALIQTSRTSGLEIDYTTESGEYYYLREEGMPLMKGTSFGGGLSFSKNTKGALAPIGAHFSLGLISHKYKVTYENMYLTNRSSSTPFIEDLQDHTTDLNYYSLEISFGTNQPITRNLYYHLGFSSSINSLLLKKSQFTNDSYSENEIDSGLLSNNIDGLMFRDIAVLKLGLGFMLF